MIIGKKTIVPGADFSGIKINDTPVTLASISVTQPPTKTTYYVTDDFEPAGMKVTATYNIQGGGTMTKDVTDYDYTPKSFDTAGTQDITITYTYKGVTKTTTTSVTVQNQVSYQITDNLENGSLGGDTIILEGSTANVTIIPLEGAVLPQTKEVINVTGATLDSYNDTTGAMVVSTPTDGVVITARCPDEDTWMDTVALGGKTYREIFADSTANGPKLMAFDGMTYYKTDKMCVYPQSGNTSFYTGLANADTLGRSLLIDNGTDGVRAAILINKADPSGSAIWGTGKWAVGDSLFIAAKIKGGLVSGTRPEAGIYTKLGLNQGSSGQPAGIIYIADIADENESEFSDWTVRTCLAQATVASNSGNAYFGFASLAASTNRASYYVDDVFILNVTKLFGSGNEPSEADLRATYETFVNLWKYHNELDAPIPPTPPTPTGYTITNNVTNGTLTGATEMTTSASVTIVPTGTNTLPQTKEVITVSNASFDSYDASTGVMALSNATGNVTITGRCPDADTWMDTAVLGGKTYREIFATNTASGPKLMFYDGMTYIAQDKMYVYTASGSTNFYTGTANADTLGRSLHLVKNASDTTNTRACFCINRSDASTTIWSGTKWNAGDKLFLAAKVKGGVTGGTRPAESASNTKMAINQGSSGMAFGTCAIVDLADPNESEFATWTTRTKLDTANVAMNSSYAYFGFPSLSSYADLSIDYYVDDVFIINVTKIFGSGNEPSEADLTSCYEAFVTAWKSHNVYNQQ